MRNAWGGGGDFGEGEQQPVNVGSGGTHGLEIGHGYFLANQDLDQPFGKQHAVKRSLFRSTQPR